MGSALIIDSVSEFNASTFNQFLVAGGGKAGVFVWYRRLRYTGAAWEVVSTTDSAKIASAALAWNGTSNQLQITLTDFSAPPVVLATPVAADAGYNVKAHAASATQAVVKFYAISGGALITVLSTSMDVNVLIIGVYP